MGTWKVEEITSSQAKIIMVFEFQYTKKVYNWLLHPLLEMNFRKICRELLNNWQKKIEAHFHKTTILQQF